MGFDGKGLIMNGQGMTNPIYIEEIPCYVGLGYDKGEVGECTKEARVREGPREEPMPLTLQKRREQPFNHGKSIEK